MRSFYDLAILSRLKWFFHTYRKFLKFIQFADSMNLHIPTEFNCDIRDIHALLRKLVPLEIVIQQANRQRALRFHVLPDDKIHRACFYHAHVAVRS